MSESKVDCGGDRVSFTTATVQLIEDSPVVDTQTVTVPP
jgi:hypothetical protein